MLSVCTWYLCAKFGYYCELYLLHFLTTSEPPHVCCTCMSRVHHVTWKVVCTECTCHIAHPSPLPPRPAEPRGVLLHHRGGPGETSKEGPEGPSGRLDQYPSCCGCCTLTHSVHAQCAPVHIERACSGDLVPVMYSCPGLRFKGTTPASAVWLEGNALSAVCTFTIL